MRDSQDWLELTIDETLRNRVKLIGYNEWSMIGYPDEVIQELKSAIRKHILQEALGILKDEPEQGWEARNTPTEERNQLRQELRNKFNDKYKED